MENKRQPGGSLRARDNAGGGNAREFPCDVKRASQPASQQASKLAGQQQVSENEQAPLELDQPRRLVRTLCSLWLAGSKQASERAR